MMTIEISHQHQGKYTAADPRSRQPCHQTGRNIVAIGRPSEKALVKKMDDVSIGYDAKGSPVDTPCSLARLSSSNRARGADRSLFLSFCVTLFKNSKVFEICCVHSSREDSLASPEMMEENVASKTDTNSNQFRFL